MRRSFDSLARRYATTWTEHDKINFYRYRSIYRSKVKGAKAAFYRQEVNRLQNVPGGLFKLIRSVSGHQRRQKQKLGKLLVNGHQLSKDKDISDALATHFSYAPSSTSDSNPLEFLPRQPNAMPFSLSFIDPGDLVKVAGSMNADLRNALSDTPSKILKSAMPLIAVPLAYIFNVSLRREIFPESLKDARVVPLYKGKGPRTDPNNYRPIALADFISKLFERCVKAQLAKHVDTYALLAETQYGFRPARSTELALSDITEFIRRGANGGNAVVGVFLDVAKAFNSLQHDILVKILSHLGVDSNSCNWFSSYLGGRAIVVQVGESLSEKAATPHGIPQGPVLGPFCFILYINVVLFAINRMSPKIRAVSFADDTSVLFKVCKETVRQDVDAINETLVRLSTAFSALRLTLNASKTKLVVFKSAHSQVHIGDEDVNLNGSSLEVVSAATVLGIPLQGDLKWTNLADQITSKGRVVSACLSRLRSASLPVSSVLHAYRAFMEPHLGYCISVWGATYSNVKQRIQVVQNDALRAALGLRWTSSVSRARAKHQVLSINDMFNYRAGTTIFKWSTGKLPVGEMFDWSFNATSSRNLRVDRSRDLVAPIDRTVFLQHGPRNSAITAWNHLPLDVRGAESLPDFKRRIRRYLLNA